MRKIAQAFTMLAAIAVASFTAAGCSGGGHGNTLITQVTPPNTGLKFKDKSNGQEKATDELKQGEKRVYQVFDANNVQITGSQLQSFTLSNGKGTVTRNGDDLEFTASSTETGSTILSASAFKDNTNYAGGLTINVKAVALTSVTFKTGSVSGAVLNQPLVMQTNSNTLVYLSGTAVDGTTNVALNDADIVSVVVNGAALNSVSKAGGNLSINSSGTAGSADITIKVNRGGTGEVSATLQVTVQGSGSGGTTTSSSPLASLRFQSAATGLDIVTPYQQVINSSFTFIPRGTLQDGSQFNPTNSELTVSSFNNGTVGSVTQSNGQVTLYTTGTTGSGVLTVTVSKNGANVTQTMNVDVVTVLTNPQPSSGSGGGNPGTVFTTLTISGPGSNPNAGVPTQMSVSGSTSDPAVINWSFVNRSTLDNRDGVVGADGKVTAAKANVSLQTMAFGLGPAVNLTSTNTSPSGGTWTVYGNRPTISNTVTVTSTGTSPTGLILFAPGFMSVGERYQFMVKDLDNGNDVSLNATLAISDTNIVTTTNNSSGQPLVLVAKKDGVATLTATFGVKTFVHKIRVGVGNPMISQFNGQGWYDQFDRDGMPYVDPANSSQRILPRLFNLSKITHNTSATPVYLGFPIGTNINGSTATTLSVFTDTAGTVWGLYLQTYPDGSGSYDLEPNQYVRTTNPINTANFGNSSYFGWPDGLDGSAYYDEYSGGNKNLSKSVQRNSDLSQVRVAPLNRS